MNEKPVFPFHTLEVPLTEENRYWFPAVISVCSEYVPIPFLSLKFEYLNPKLTAFNDKISYYDWNKSF